MEEKKYKESILYIIVRPIIKVLFLFLYRPKIEGRENIPNSGRIILAGNHTNNFDCLLLMSSTKRCIHFLAKDELWKGPKKIIFSNMGLIPVNRRQKDPNSLRSAEKYLNHEKVIGIFPEGTTEKEKGKLLPFKIGAVKMAYDTNTKIIPFAITGKYKIFSNNLKIKFGESLTINSENLTQQNDKLKETIEKLMVGDK